MLPGAVHVGVTTEGKTVYLDSEARSQNLHVIGLPKGGKSGLLEHMIRQDIVNGTAAPLSISSASRRRTVE